MPVTIDLPGVEILAPISESYAEILTPEAVAFLVDLQRAFNARRKALLEARHARQKRLDAGEKPDFLAETKAIREAEWTVAPLPADILDRRVEITGPVDRKMIINALNSGAKVFMADFEDSNTPTWDNLIDGQINLRDAIRRTITYTDPATGKQYKLNDKTAVLFVRARGWHLEERHVLRRWRADVRLHLRLRPLLLPQRQGAAGARQRPLLLPAQDGEPPRGAAVERRLHPRASRSSACRREPSRARC